MGGRQHTQILGLKGHELLGAQPCHLCRGKSSGLGCAESHYLRSGQRRHLRAGQSGDHAGTERLKIRGGKDGQLACLQPYDLLQSQSRRLLQRQDPDLVSRQGTDPGSAKRDDLVSGEPCNLIHHQRLNLAC